MIEMGYYNSMKLTCNDLKQFKAIMKSNSFKNLETEFEDGTAFITTPNSLPIKEIKELSIQYYDSIFTAEYIYANEDNTIHFSKYKNGEEISEVLMPIYTLTSQSEEKMEDEKRLMGVCYNRLIDKAIQLFQRIDITKQDEKGQKYIDFVSGITLTVEDGNYQMVLSKSHSDIGIKCFEKEEIITVNLVPVGSLSPF
jgi:hypothetical protein